MRDPFLAISSTTEGPPTRTVPWMKMATKPANMTIIWNTSVQITAFMPPCYRQREKTDRKTHHNTKTNMSDTQPPGVFPLTLGI